MWSISKAGEKRWPFIKPLSIFVCSQFNSHWMQTFWINRGIRSLHSNISTMFLFTFLYSRFFNLLRQYLPMIQRVLFIKINFQLMLFFTYVYCLQVSTVTYVRGLLKKVVRAVDCAAYADMRERWQLTLNLKMLSLSRSRNYFELCSSKQQSFGRSYPSRFEGNKECISFDHLECN